MKICMIGTYPPRECGIATFSNNLLSAIKTAATCSNENVESFVVAMNDNENYKYSSEVKYIIKQNEQSDYIKAASFINKSKANICLLQHEYGIFGGDNGLYILSLVNNLEIPLMVTLHTVLKEPSFMQKNIVQKIAERAYKLIVMSHLAVDFLRDIYEVPEEKIAIIKHGVPALADEVIQIQKDLTPFRDKKILFTFGLLSRNKGIETVIQALPDVVKKHDDVVYIVLGNTHPGVIKHSGEEYRNYLTKLASELGVEKHLHFIKGFVTDEQLFAYLKSIDIYITPYLNEAQITSGTLSYAIGAGAAVVSTPYWHAQELLAKGRGMLYPFKDPQALSEVLNELLDNPYELSQIRKKAYQYGKQLEWPKIGKEYIQTAKAAITEYHSTGKKNNSVPQEFEEMPAFNLAHIKRLTDSTGMIQHAKYGIPNFKEGYCLDDNARAMIMMLMTYKEYGEKESLELMNVYLSYVHYMQRDDGLFRNFLHYNRQYLDDIGSEDSFGRTVWALGYLVKHAPNNSYREFGLELFNKAYPHFTELKDIRGIANTIIGISYYLKQFQTDEQMVQVLVKLTKKLLDGYAQHGSTSWYWLEKSMTYDNGIVPLSLLHSYEITNNTHVLDTALQSIAFLESKTLYKGYLTPIGNNGWYTKNSDIPMFDQQAIEVMAMVLLYEQAYNVTKDNDYLKQISTCFAWFLGKNELHVPLYDQETNACCDGIHDHGVNRNQGAESTLAYFISYLTIYKSLQLKFNVTVKSEDGSLRKSFEPVAV